MKGVIQKQAIRVIQTVEPKPQLKENEAIVRHMAFAQFDGFQLRKIYESVATERVK